MLQKKITLSQWIILSELSLLCMNTELSEHVSQEKWNPNFAEVKNTFINLVMKIITIIWFSQLFMSLYTVHNLHTCLLNSGYDLYVTFSLLTKSRVTCSRHATEYGIMTLLIPNASAVHVHHACWQVIFPIHFHHPGRYMCVATVGKYKWLIVGEVLYVVYFAWF